MRKTLLASVTVVVLCAALFSIIFVVFVRELPQTQREPPTASPVVTGRFVQESGEPIPKVEIVFRWEEARKAPVLSDKNGQFSFPVSKEERVVVLARHENFVFKRFIVKEQEDDRSEIPLGDIVLKSGFKPAIQVLDKKGKPVNNVWVQLDTVISQEELDAQNRETQAEQEARTRVGITAAEIDMLMKERMERERSRSNDVLDRAHFRQYAFREALTNASGKAVLGPVEAGNFFARVVDRPSHNGLFFRNDDKLFVLARVAKFQSSARPIKGVYEAAALTLSPDSPTAAIQAVESINVTVRFSGTAARGRTAIGSISGGRDKEVSPDFSEATLSTLYQNRSLDKDKLLFAIPLRLQEATLSPSVIQSGAAYREYQNELAYRCFIDGKEIEQKRRAWSYSFPIEPFDGDKEIQIAVYKAPVITLHAVDEEGKPIKEYFAGAQYTRHASMPEILWDAEGVRFKNFEKRFLLICWTQIANKLHYPYADMDVEFGWRNFGKDASKVNADHILPDEELRLYVVAKDYAVAEQTIPKLKEGEKKELTITLKRE